MLIRFRRNTYLDYLNQRLRFFGGKKIGERKGGKYLRKQKCHADWSKIVKQSAKTAFSQIAPGIFSEQFLNLHSKRLFGLDISKHIGTFFHLKLVALCKISVSLTQTRQVSWGAQALIEQDLARTDVTPDRIVVNQRSKRGKCHQHMCQVDKGKTGQRITQRTLDTS